MKYLLTVIVSMISIGANAADVQDCMIRTTGRYLTAKGALSTVIERNTSEKFGIKSDMCGAILKNAYHVQPKIDLLCKSYGAIAVVVEGIHKQVIAGVSSSVLVGSYVYRCPIVLIPNSDGGGSGDGGGGGGM